MQRGFTYFTALFVLAIMAGGLALIGEVWHTSNLREKEAELLHIGNEYRKAIERYYLASKDQKVRTYPKNLSDLIKDPRDAAFEGKARYADWQFTFSPPAAATKPAAKPAAAK